jgi:hypothetical protein
MLNLKAEPAPGKLIYCSGGDGHTFPYMPPPAIPVPAARPALDAPEPAAPPSSLGFPLAIATGVAMILLSGAAVFGMRTLVVPTGSNPPVHKAEDNSSPDADPPSDKKDGPSPIPIIERPQPVLPRGPVYNLPPELQDKVNEAVRKGTEYLKNNQCDDGSWKNGGHAPAHTALPALTLLECGVPADDPRIQKAAKRVREALDDREAGFHTYSAALMLLFLERLGDPADKNHIKTLALRFVVGQNTDGAHAERPRRPSTPCRTTSANCRCSPAPEAARNASQARVAHARPGRARASQRLERSR